MSLKYRLSKYYTLLPELNRLLRETVSGMQIIDLVMGKEGEQDFYSTLGDRCLRVFRKQLSDIMVHGKVCPELFLQRVVANE